MKNLLFWLLIAFSGPLFSQVIDIEHMRLDTENQGFAGSIGLNFKLIKNTRNLFAFGSTAYVQYRKNDHLVFFINNLAYQTVDDTENINNGTNHFRYNYYWKPKIILEAFFQSQYNSIALIDQRQLTGAGPRFILKEEVRFKSYLGTIIMFEHEKVKDVQPIYNDDWRMSLYLALRYLPTDNIALASTTFYQPRIDAFSDYRVYSHNSATIKIYGKLNFVITYILDFDVAPATGIPNTQYQLLNGISYSFD